MGYCRIIICDECGKTCFPNSISHYKHGAVQGARESGWFCIGFHAYALCTDCRKQYTEKQMAKRSYEWHKKIAEAEAEAEAGVGQ